MVFMMYTPAEANKLLKKLNEAHYSMIWDERDLCQFTASVDEDLEYARPDYDYEATQKEIAELERKIRTIKHALNQFNNSHKVDGFDMTVDEALIYLPQLSQRIKRLKEMKQTRPRERNMRTSLNGAVEYTYANYDVKQARKDYDQAFDELSRLQISLDTLNTREKFPIDL